MLHLPTDLKTFDSLHDFGDTASNRSAQKGIDQLGIVMPAITQPQKDGQGAPAILIPRLGSQRLYRAKKNFKIDNCKTMVRSKTVSYERQATAAMDSCVLENAWSFTKNGSGITWDQLFVREGDPKYIDPATLSDVVVIANGTDQDNYYESKLRKNNDPAIATRRNIVGHWILKYMFPGYTGSQAVGVTFDAAGGKTVKVFSGMGQVKAIVTPQNISDSASTSLDPFADFKMLGHKRTEFLFPQTPIDPLSGQPSPNWICKSQEYSKDWCRISFQNVNYNTNSPNGFKIRLEWGGPYAQGHQIAADTFTIDYDTLGFTNAVGGGAAQGPSAPYLAGLINTIASHQNPQDAIHAMKNDTSLQPDIGTIIPLIPLIQHLYNSASLQQMAQVLGQSVLNLIIGLLFDFKRAGDYEQANAAEWAQQNDPSQLTILSTGDVLCSTYSRSIKQPCILRGIGGGGEGGSAIALFRFPQSGTREPNSQSYDYFVKMLDHMETIDSIWDSTEGNEVKSFNALKEGLRKYMQMDAFENGKLKTVVIHKGKGKAKSSLEDILAPSANSVFVERLGDADARYHNYANYLFSILLKYKYNDLYLQLTDANDTEAEGAAKNLATIQADLAAADSPRLHGYLSIKDICELIISLRQPILKKMRDDNANIKAQEHGAHDFSQVAIQKLDAILKELQQTDTGTWLDANQQNTLAYVIEHALLGDYFDAIKQMMLTVDKINSLTDSDPITLILMKLKERKVTSDEINDFFAKNVFLLYNTPPPRLKNLNLFLKDIGFNIPLFYKCWAQFIHFLNGMPSMLNDITMVAGGRSSFVGKYEKDEHRISILNTEYKNEDLRNKLFNGPHGISKLIENFENWFTRYRIAMGNTLQAQINEQPQPGLLHEPLPNLRRPPRNFDRALDDALSKQLEKFNILNPNLYSTDGEWQPSCFSYLMQLLEVTAQNINQGGGGVRSPGMDNESAKGRVQAGGGDFPCLEIGMLGRTRSNPVGKACRENVFIEVLNLIEKIALKCNEFINDNINGYYLEATLPTGDGDGGDDSDEGDDTPIPDGCEEYDQGEEQEDSGTFAHHQQHQHQLYQQQQVQQVQQQQQHTDPHLAWARYNVFSAYFNLFQVLNYYCDGYTTVGDADGGETIIQPLLHPNNAQLKEIIWQLKQTGGLHGTDGHQIYQAVEAELKRLIESGDLSVAHELRGHLLNEIRRVWKDWDFDGMFMDITNQIALGCNTTKDDVDSFLFNIQQFWIDSLLKNLELLSDLTEGSNTWQWNVTSNGVPAIQFNGEYEYINEITAMLFGGPRDMGSNDNNIFRFAQLHTIFSTNANAFNPYIATNHGRSRQQAFEEAYEGIVPNGHVPRKNIRLYNEENRTHNYLIDLIKKYPTALRNPHGEDWDVLSAETAFIIPQFFLIESVVNGQFQIFTAPPRSTHQGGFKNSKKRRKRKKTRKRKRRKYRTIKKKRRRRKVKSLKRRRRRRRKTRGK